MTKEKKYNMASIIAITAYILLGFLAFGGIFIEFPKPFIMVSFVVLIFTLGFSLGHIFDYVEKSVKEKEKNKISKEIREKVKALGYDADMLLDPDLLAYCGYKLDGDRLVPTYYEPNPYTPIEEIKKHIEEHEK